MSDGRFHHRPPRMTEELNEPGPGVGQCRVGRLMRQNGIQVVRSERRSSARPTGITPSASSQPAATGLCRGPAEAQGAGDLHLLSGRVRDGSVWRSSSTCSRDMVSDQLSATGGTRRASMMEEDQKPGVGPVVPTADRIHPVQRRADPQAACSLSAPRPATRRTSSLSLPSRKAWTGSVLHRRSDTLARKPDGRD